MAYPETMMRAAFLTLLIAPAACAGACSGGAGAAPARLTFDPSAPAQTMEGFGGSNVMLAPLTDAQADLFFGTSSGIGLTIFRLGIANPESGTGTYFQDNDPGYNNSILDAKKALARNPAVKVIATPWSPSATYKTTGSIKSGSLLPSSYASWANYMGAAVDSARSQGIDLYAVGMQNEPDHDSKGAWEMCLYTPEQARDFIKVLGPILAARSPAPKLIAPEPASWSRMWSGGGGYADVIAADPAALSQIGIWGTHQYGNPFGSVSPPGAQHGRPIWVTEASENIPTDNTMPQGLRIARWIHHAIVVGKASAWLHWWLVSDGPHTQGLLARDGVTQSKRLWVLGNYSKFVRPGFVRHGHTGAAPADVLVTFYRGTTSSDTVVVAINEATSPSTLRFSLGAAKTVTPWITDASRNLAEQAPAAVVGGEFSYALPPQSLTTFVAGSR